ncbi:DUF4175 family protein [Lishizhenia sp.]|uniref:DUF4175 family protein n=1 Tax=Lishizhenia sp. TaxID=2497594 RepID=UPI00299DD5EA|nr:DUF4175 family protein [Lishizhenia sp.]MDX1444592.1 DUF4175 family protein [Lishizhenia sp.]
MGAFDRLIEQIDAFIRKYYKNQLVKGILLFSAFALTCFLLVNLLEYFGRFNSTVRAVLFFSALAFILYLFVYYFIIPLAKLTSFGKRINREQASIIIGDFFPNVKDSLLNTLQLEAASRDQKQYDLLLASVEQKSNQLSAVPFASAIDIRENRKYLKYVLPVVLTVLAIAVFAPSFYKEGTERLVNYNTHYAIPAPFDFVLENDVLKVEQGEAVDLSLRLKATKNEPLPDKVFVHSDQGVFLMEQSTKDKRLYTFPKVTKDMSVYFSANGFESESYLIDVVGKASFVKFNAELMYPAYLGLKNEVVENVADLLVPEGTVVKYDMLTKNAKRLEIGVGDSIQMFEEKGVNFSTKVQHDEQISFALVSQDLENKEEVSYVIEVIKDAYPTLSVVREVDSTDINKVRFNGAAKDDIGILEVAFVYTVEGKEGTKRKERTVLPGIGQTEGLIDMSFNFSQLSLLPEDRVSYYFEVLDNDKVNGSKRTKSAMYTLAIPSKEELKKERQEDLNKANSAMEEAMKKAEDFQKSVNDLKKNLLNNKASDWNKKQRLEDVKKQQQSLEKMLEDLKKDLEDSWEKKDKFSEEELELLEKQELLDELLNELMDDELKDLLEELEELLERQQENGQKEVTEEVEKSAEELNKELDRALEQLKQLQVNEKLNDIEESLEELADEMKELSESDKNAEEKLDDQKSLENEFDKLMKDYEETLKENEELKRPLDMEDLDEDKEDVKEEFSESEENLSKSKESKSKENQKNAAEKMKEMAAKINGMQMQSQQEQNQEDYEFLRACLESLVNLSLSQEANMDVFANLDSSDPDYINVGRQQRKIMDDAEPVKDSLEALAVRNPKIAKFIDQELRAIERNYANLLEDIDERKLTSLVVKQQYVMTSYNNLALLFNESLEQMQQEMQSQEGGNGSCNNPGGQGKGSSGNSSMESMKEMLKKQLESMKKGMSPGGNKPGDKQGSSPIPMGAQQAARMAAQQSEIRRRLEQMKNELNKGGKREGDILNPLLEELEKQQEELINKQWNQELVNRQQDILTRMFESEKALKERGFDEQRESEEGKNTEKGNPIDFLEYKKLKEKQLELLRSLNPTLERYYKDRASEYFNRVN